MKQEKDTHTVHQNTAAAKQPETHKIHRAADELTLLRHHLTEIEKHACKASDILSSYLGTLSTEDMIKRISELKIPGGSMKLLFASILPEHGHADMILITEEIKKRQSTNKTQDVTDHINYTAL